jgi:hypothetical protein
MTGGRHYSSDANIKRVQGDGESPKRKEKELQVKV